MGCPMCEARECERIGSLGSSEYVRCRACGFDYVMGDAYEDDYDEFDEDNFTRAGDGGILGDDGDERDDFPCEGGIIDEIYRTLS